MSRPAPVASAIPLKVDGIGLEPSLLFDLVIWVSAVRVVLVASYEIVARFF